MMRNSTSRDLANQLYDGHLEQAVSVDDFRRPPGNVALTLPRLQG